MNKLLATQSNNNGQIEWAFSSLIEADYLSEYVASFMTWFANEFPNSYQPDAIGNTAYYYVDQDVIDYVNSKALIDAFELWLKDSFTELAPPKAETDIEEVVYKLELALDNTTEFFAEYDMVSGGLDCAYGLPQIIYEEQLQGAFVSFLEYESGFKLIPTDEGVCIYTIPCVSLSKVLKSFFKSLTVVS